MVLSVFEVLFSSIVVNLCLFLWLLDGNDLCRMYWGWFSSGAKVFLLVGMEFWFSDPILLIGGCSGVSRTYHFEFMSAGVEFRTFLKLFLHRHLCLILKLRVVFPSLGNFFYGFSLFVGQSCLFQYFLGNYFSCFVVFCVSSIVMSCSNLSISFWSMESSLPGASSSSSSGWLYIDLNLPISMGGSVDYMMIGGIKLQGVVLSLSLLLSRKSLLAEWMEVCVSPLVSCWIVCAMLWYSRYLALAHESTYITRQGDSHWLDFSKFLAFEFTLATSS